MQGFTRKITPHYPPLPVSPFFSTLQIAAEHSNRRVKPEPDGLISAMSRTATHFVTVDP
jgi:hypothetical protein